MVNMTTVTISEKTALKNEAEAQPSSYRQSHHGLSEKRATEADVLVQLKSNLVQLEDLHHRLRFMMRELAYLLKKN